MLDFVMGLRGRRQRDYNLCPIHTTERECSGRLVERHVSKSVRDLRITFHWRICRCIQLRVDCKIEYVKRGLYDFRFSFHLEEHKLYRQYSAFDIRQDHRWNLDMTVGYIEERAERMAVGVRKPYSEVHTLSVPVE